jgi:hypothetical protein
MDAFEQLVSEILWMQARPSRRMKVSASRRESV